LWHGLEDCTRGKKSTSCRFFTLKFCLWQNFTIVGNSGIKSGTSPAVRLRFHAAWEEGGNREIGAGKKGLKKP